MLPASLLMIRPHHVIPRTVIVLEPYDLVTLMLFLTVVMLVTVEMYFFMSSRLASVILCCMTLGIDSA